MILAHYQIVDRICTPTGSCLYRGRALKDGTPVMLKLLDPQDASAAKTACFRREYLLLQSLNVPEIAKPIALVDEGGYLAMVVEDFAGESLDAVFANDRRMDLPTSLAIASHLSHAMMGMHAAQVIHQDIRPPNILVTPENQIRIMDLTIAIAQGREAVSFGQCAAHSTDWAYMSPEQTGRMNRPVDYRTDFYSLGITLYRMLTRELPFTANDPLEWTHCHIARTPPPPHAIAPTVPQPVSDIVMKLLAKLPEERYQSAHGLQVDLDRCLAQWQASGCIESFPLGAADRSDRFQIPHKLYGRDREITLLLAAFDHMAATGEATMVTISGYSGIGKSSLVHELHKPIVPARGYFIAGKFDQYMRDIPYATLTQAFRGMVQQLLAESEARIANWRHEIQEAVGGNGQLIINVLPQIELIIGKQAPVPDLPPVEAQHRFRMVFRQFLSVFTRKEHPLVLFLDDLQWIDAPSATLIEDVLSHADTRYLLLIGAYRDNEVDAAHILITSVEAIRNSGVSVTDIKLAPLSVMDLNQLVADTLHADKPSCEPLTRLVFERTEGNPFFFTQFLSSLHQDGLFWHDTKDWVWKWDLGKIEARNFADNVVDLMVGKLRKLPVQTQDILQLAACLGNKFDLRSLALVSGMSDVEQCLSPAVHEGLIIHTNGSAKFLHDRIQQAAYSLIPEVHRDAVHLRIGRVLMTSLVADDMAEQLFDVVNQLNHGSALLIDPDEKAQVAELNLRAGRKAKVSTAYPSACVYLSAGMALLDDSCWTSRYELGFSLWLERATCEFLSGNFEFAEQLIVDLLPRSVSKTDKAAVYSLQVEICEVRSQYGRAVDYALKCLSLFGIDMVAHPTRAQVQAEYEKFWQYLGQRKIESLIDLPPTTDPEILAAMHMLSALLAPTLNTDINLLHLHPVHIVNLTLKSGTTSASTYGYGWLGLFLGPVFHRYSEGYQFGKLAVDLVEKHGLIQYKAKLYLAIGLIAFWTQPIKASFDFFRTAFDSGVAAGDLTFACYGCNNIITTLLVRGDPLDEVWHESEKLLSFVRKVKFNDVVDIIVSQQRLIQAMRGRTLQFSTFSDEQFDEAAFEAHLADARMMAMVCWYWILKVQARFMSGDYEAALVASAKAQQLLWSSDAFMQLLDYHYYTALTKAAIHDSAAPERQSGLRAEMAVHREQLREWAENGSATFLDKHALVAAETARIERRDLDAMHLYQKAIQSARENGFVHNQGIAYELASGFYRTRGFQEFADTYLHQARSCFVQWGADGKVRQLDDRYPQLLAQSASPSAASLGGMAQLDALSVAKAAQAISGRIVLEELVDTLMRIVLENAGAQTGTLLLARGEDLVLAAEASVAQLTVQVRPHLGQALPASPLPAAILNYVRRSQTQVLLADATEPNPFSADPYLARRQPKSVLCLPIVRQTTLIGVLYLENTLITHAFTPQRVTVLELLASQAAISLENALLYTDLQQENSERKRVEETLREREARIRRLVDSNIIGIFFWDLQGRISDANDAFLRLIGYDRQELLSGQVQWAQMTPPEYFAADARAIEEIRHTRTCSTYEKAFVRKDGTRLPVLIGAALLEGSQENGVAFVLDLTERKQAEAERTARQAAEAANRAKSTFLANMSHELRTPLNSILGYAQILERDPVLAERQLAEVNVIRKSGEHLLTLINDILDLAKIEASKMELYLADFTLLPFVQGIANMVGVKAAQKGLELVCDLGSGLPQGIRADEKRLRQVLLNLLSNAIKFTDRGQVTLRVRFAPPQRLCFEVQDTGIGIAPDQLATIFEPFEQVGDMRRRLAGTGLGLTISRQYVRLMGGEIQVESRPGQGSTFRIEVEAPPVQAVRAATACKTVTGYAGPCKKILVVDDIAENRAVVIDLLTPLGFEVVEAANGREGLELAQRLRPDLILMDIAMPELDGLAATRLLRQLGALREVPIIAMSASVSASDSEQSLTAGMNVFLPKPLEADKLLEQMDKLLQLEWVYGIAPAETETEAGSIVVPPADEMKVLHQLAKLGNMQHIMAQADHLTQLDARYRPFANRLSLLARGFTSPRPS